jgi:hypothetical protein
MPSVSDEFERIAGVLTYTYDAVQLYPRDSDDFAAGAIDVPDATTLGDLHETPPEYDTRVVLEDLVVLGVIDDISAEGPAIFVQDADDENDETFEAGMWLGIRNYTEFTGVEDEAGLEVGDVVDIVGLFKNRYGENVYEIRLEEIERTGSGGLFTTNAFEDSATLLSDADNLEGAYVELSAGSLGLLHLDEYGSILLAASDLSSDRTESAGLVFDLTYTFDTFDAAASHIAGFDTVVGAGPLWYRRSGDVNADMEGAQTWDVHRILILETADLTED